eukprot:m.163434 g.163434  ORF g.163434 m.163434 type:complete len:67 (-) comp16550_c0_seq1:3642-3842(-)
MSKHLFCTLCHNNKAIQSNSTGSSCIVSCKSQAPLPNNRNSCLCSPVSADRCEIVSTVIPCASASL